MFKRIWSWIFGVRKPQPDHMSRNRGQLSFVISHAPVPANALCSCRPITKGVSPRRETAKPAPIAKRTTNAKDITKTVVKKK